MTKECYIYFLTGNDIQESVLAFKLFINGFNHYIPVIQIDGTQLYGPYPTVLLTATTVDGFSHILQLAFAIVEAENLSSWV